MSQPSQDFQKSAVFLVDASSYIFRAYYAMRAGLKAPDGTPTHATYGFTQMVLSLLDKYKPAGCVFVWDHKERGFRHEAFPDYKANRSVPPEDLGIQIKNSKAIIDILGVVQVAKGGFEADDIIATLVAKNPESKFVIVTGDKDLLQLVGPNVWCLDTMKDKWSNADECVEKFGVEPKKVPDVQALSGDSVDNIPGAPGIGPKTATELVKHFGDLETIIAEASRRFATGHLEPFKSDPLKGKRIEAIGANVDLIRTSLKLVTLHPDAPVESHLDHYARRSINEQALNETCTRLGFQKLLEKIRALTPTASDGVAQTVLSETHDPFAPSETSITVLPTASRFKFEAVCVKSLAQLEEIFFKFGNAEIFCLDTETKSLESRSLQNLVGFSFAFEAAQGFYVPLRHNLDPKDNLPVEEALSLLRTFIETRPLGSRIVFQNAKFDLHVLRSERIEFPKDLRIDDTMVASYVIDPGAAHGMDDLSKRYLGHQPISFEEALGEASDFSLVELERATQYSAEDAAVTRALWDVLSAKLQETPALWNVYDFLDRPLIPVLFEIEHTGVSLDQARLHEYSKLLHTELANREEACLKQLREESGLEIPLDFNLGSPRQVGHILYEKLGLPVLKKNKTGPSTDVSVLEELAESHPFPKALLEIRELNKLLSTYIDAFPQLVDSKTHRLHTDFAQTVAITGRLSSTNPNLQNIPIRTDRGRLIRESFCSAGKGSVLVGADYSQVELRILAHMSQDPELLRAFREGADIHRRTASIMLKKSESSITDDERRMAKTINFGIIYGQTAFGLSKQLHISRGEASAFIEAYFQSYPGIRAYNDGAIEKARSTERVVTLTGRSRLLPEIHSKNVAVRQFAERTAINSPIQGTAADLIKAAMISCYNSIQDKFPKARLVLQVHDELLLECAEDDSEALRDHVVRVMENPDLLRPMGVEPWAVLMKAEAAIGTHWGQL